MQPRTVDGTHPPPPPKPGNNSVIDKFPIGYSPLPPYNLNKNKHSLPFQNHDNSLTTYALFQRLSELTSSATVSMPRGMQHEGVYKPPQVR